jgi:hypothetical protein
MPFPKGRNRSLSPLRRLMCDFLHFSRLIPTVAVERRMDLLPVVRARQALAQRPGWFTLFLKAFGLVARQREELRTSFLSLPWPYLHVHARNVASLPIERRVADEDGVFFLQVHQPENLSLMELEALIRQGKTDPVETIACYRRQLLNARLPGPMRRLLWRLGLNLFPNKRARFFGTFGVTGVASLGAPSLHLISPLTCTLAYGVIGPDGSVLVRLFYDHRVMDGVVPARALEDLEKTLCGPVVEELGALARTAA